MKKKHGNQYLCRTCKKEQTEEGGKGKKKKTKNRGSSANHVYFGYTFNVKILRENLVASTMRVKIVKKNYKKMNTNILLLF